VRSLGALRHSALSARHCARLPFCSPFGPGSRSRPVQSGRSHSTDTVMV
jgi:hypothetical protein